MDKYVAFIPARGGSKSIPLKNIKSIAGKPLILWSIEAALNCEKIDKVYLSTDSDEISNVANRIKDKRFEVIGRNPSTATDTATTESAMLDFSESHIFDNIILIQATSPLLTSKDLTNAIELHENSSMDSLLSVVRQKRFVWKEQDSNLAVPVNYNPMRRPRRQEFEGYLVENGAIYITTYNSLKNLECRMSRNVISYEMPEETYYELDEPTDWIIIEQLLKTRQHDFKKIKLLISDVDGVLTDSGMYYTEVGDEIKKFNTRDGMAIKLFNDHGIRFAFLTGENTKLLQTRAEKLGVECVCQGRSNKLPAFETIRKKYNLEYSEIAYVGDDIIDIPVLNKVGFPICPSDAVAEVKKICTTITKSAGGEGVIREIFELWNSA